MTEETRESLGKWARQCGGYEMRFTPGETGKLARLERVRRWLMAGEDGLPYEDAGNKLLAPLEAAGATDLAGWLYVLDEGKYARLVNDRDDFLYLMIRSLYEDQRHDPENCGARGALKWMREFWCSGSDSQRWSGQHLLEMLAVPVTKAHDLWGWGTRVEAPVQAVKSESELVTWAELVAYRKKNPGKHWTKNQRDIALREFDKRGGNMPEKKSATLREMAKELGLGDNYQPLSSALWGKRKREQKQPPKPSTPDASEENSKAA